MLNSSSTSHSIYGYYVLGSWWSHYWPSLSCRQYLVSTFPGIIISRAFESMSGCKELVLDILHDFIKEEINPLYPVNVYSMMFFFSVIVMINSFFYPRKLQSPRFYFIGAYSSCIRYPHAVWYLRMLTPCMSVLDYEWVISDSV